MNLATVVFYSCCRCGAVSAAAAPVAAAAADIAAAVAWGHMRSRGRRQMKQQRRHKFSISALIPICFDHLQMKSSEVALDVL